MYTYINDPKDNEQTHHLFLMLLYFLLILLVGIRCHYLMGTLYNSVLLQPLPNYILSDIMPTT